MIIRNYTDKDEQGWLRCRVLSFLNTAYFDNVLNKKEIYENPSIELVAEKDNQIVGLLDIEYEQEPKEVCTAKEKNGGMIWHIAVHPDFQRQGIGERLLETAIQEAKKFNLQYLEAWTRDDIWVQQWYEKMEFELSSSYYHLFMEGNELNGTVNTEVNNLYPVTLFAHYTGEDVAAFRNIKRKHECVCYVKEI